MTLLSPSIKPPHKGENSTIAWKDFRNLSDNNTKQWQKKLIEAFLILVEVIILHINMTVAALEAFMKIFIHSKEKCLKDEIVLLTGTGHGIGRELVLGLAKEGCKVVCWDMNEEGNAETYKLAKELGLHNNLHLYQCDVAKRDQVIELAEKVKKEVGDVTILINNAGIMRCKPLHEQSSSTIQNIFDVNVMGNFWTIEAFLPKMKELNAGHIVSMCSMCGIIGTPNAVPYCASKFAIRGLMEALSEEMRVNTSTNKIKFTTVYPIMVDTGLSKRPKNRFPSLINILKPETVAEDIIKAIKQEKYEIALPGFMMAFDRITRLMPRKMVQHGKDFLDTGVDPDP